MWRDYGGLEERFWIANHAVKLIDKGEARQYVADLLNVGRSAIDQRWPTLERIAH
jgi:hypothetical protein